MLAAATCRASLLSQAPSKPRSAASAPKLGLLRQGWQGKAGPRGRPASPWKPNHTRPQALPGMGDLPEQLTRDLPVHTGEVRSDLPRWLALAAYAALHLTGFPSRFVPTPDLLFSALAW
jgi:hypothetical protein